MAALSYRTEEGVRTAIERQRSLTPASPGPQKKWLIRVVLILALLAFAALYLAPRIYNLTATPYRMSQSVESAERYNVALMQIVGHEEVTITAFTALDGLRSSLAGVLDSTDKVSTELGGVIDQLEGDLRVTIDQAGTNVDVLVGSLDGLTARVNTLIEPSTGASDAVSSSRETMASILDDVRATAAHVHRTRLSAESSAGDLSGQ